MIVIAAEGISNFLLNKLLHKTNRTEIKNHSMIKSISIDFNVITNKKNTENKPIFFDGKKFNFLNALKNSKIAIEATTRTLNLNKIPPLITMYKNKGILTNAEITRVSNTAPPLFNSSESSFSILIIQ